VQRSKPVGGDATNRVTDVTDNDLRAAIKSLSDVIAPSIDPADPLAKEQVRLIVEYLEFLRCRFEFLNDRYRFELHHLLDMVSALRKCDVPYPAAITSALVEAVRAGEDAFRRAGTPVQELKRASEELAALVRAIVRGASVWDTSVRKRVETVVLEMSRERIIFERSWFFPMGYEPLRAEVPELQELVSQFEERSASWQGKGD
jgi:hypothetical protein